MYKLLFYIVFIPFSYLPDFILYGISDLAAWILRDVVKSRKKVIYSNLKHSFPEKSEEEIAVLTRKYYSHVADIYMEGFKMVGLSRKSVMKRYRCKNPELINKYYDQGKNVILISGHYNNWEYMVLSLDMQFKHFGIGVGKPLTNKKFGEILTQFRTRFGTEVIENVNVREKFERYEKEKHLSVYMMLNDQSPSNSRKAYWMMFLNQETPVLFGPEHFAKKYNYPVLFYHVNKEKRGYYSFEIEEITADPSMVEDGFITRKSVEMLEKVIKTQPEYWLWSHRRWKKTRPQEIEMNTVIKK